MWPSPKHRRKHRTTGGSSLAGPGSEDDTKASFAFDQLIRLLDRQVTVLSDLRTRASFILTANGAVAALLGQGAFQAPKRFGPLGLVIAVVGAAGSLAACLVVFRSIGDKGELSEIKSDGSGKRTWKVTVGYGELTSLLADKRLLNDAAMKAKVFSELRNVPGSNFATIARLSRWLDIAVLALVVQGVGWGVAAVLH